MDGWMDATLMGKTTAARPRSAPRHTLAPADVRRKSHDHRLLSAVMHCLRSVRPSIRGSPSGDIKGRLPPAIGGLSHLLALSLVSTVVAGPLPPALGQIAGLKMLWLDHNTKMGGPLPASLGLLNLTVLELHFSDFSGPVSSKALSFCCASFRIVSETVHFLPVCLSLAAGRAGLPPHPGLHAVQRPLEPRAAGQARQQRLRVPAPSRRRDVWRSVRLNKGPTF
eukprot:SAG22_NODE_2123_length_2975_cov_22.253477_4_plen_224_part_00